MECTFKSEDGTWCFEKGPHVRWDSVLSNGAAYCPQHDPSLITTSHIGIGGAPTRATILPRDPQARKMFPVASGFMDYFPDAICAVANLSHVGNEQHNPGQPLHWARNKSRDEADTMLRHFLQRGTRDEDGVRHSVKMVWRALALLQKELEEEPASASSEPPPTQSGQLLGVSVPRPHSRYQDQPSGVQ